MLNIYATHKSHMLESINVKEIEREREREILKCLNSAAKSRACFLCLTFRGEKDVRKGGIIKKKI